MSSLVAWFHTNFLLLPFLFFSVSRFFFLLEMGALELIGRVVSAAMQKTVKVEIKRWWTHPKYNVVWILSSCAVSPKSPHVSNVPFP